MVDFNALLNKPAADYYKPKVLPIGLYPAVISRVLFDTMPNKNKTAYCRFEIKLLGRPEDDSIPEEEWINEDGTQVNVNGKGMRCDYWLTPESTYRLAALIQQLFPGDTRPVKQLCEAAPSTHVLANVSKGTNQTNGEEFNNVSDLRPMV